MTFTSGLPHYISLIDGQLVFSYVERKIKKITAAERATIEALTQAGIRVSILVGDTVVTPADYFKGHFQAPKDSTLAPNTISQYKVKLKQLQLAAALEDDPDKKKDLEMKLKRIAGILGVTLQPLQQEEDFSPAAVQARVDELLQQAGVHTNEQPVSD